MKIARSTYPMLVTLYLVGILLQTLNLFSRELFLRFLYPLIGAGMIFFLIGFILAIKDNELIQIITDERTKKVDRSAAYYSWFSTVIFVFILSFIIILYEPTAIQIISILANELYLSMIIFHMYFNYFSKSI